MGALMRLRISPNLALPLPPGADILQAHSAGKGASHSAAKGDLD